MQTVLRLVDHLDESAAADTVRFCAVADDSRRTLGCPAPQRVYRGTPKRDEAPSVEVELLLPWPLSRGLVVLEPTWIEERSDWFRGDTLTHPLPPILLGGTHRRVALKIPFAPELPAAAEAELGIAAIPIPAKLPIFRTRELQLPKGPVLQVGLAIAPSAVRAGAAPTTFVIRAHGPFGTREVLRETIDPASASPGWLARRVDLAELAGARVRFEFGSVLDPAKSSGGRRFSLPLWGNPQILGEGSRGKQRNIILVSLDTLRGDFVGRTYQGQPLTPRLDRRRAAGVSFVNAISTHPSTTAAHASLFTSTYPVEHATFHAKQTIPTEFSTLPEILSAHAYETAAFTENAMLSAGVGFRRGFDDYYENRGVNVWDTHGDIEDTFERGLQWLEDHRADKFFLFLHTYEVHSPYAPPPAYDLFGGESKPNSKGKASAKRDRYAGEVVYTDHVLEKLFATLERLGLTEETIVVVTSDHGEGFGEHGVLGHSRTVYEEVLRVPLVLWAPGLIPARGEVDAQVSLVDLAPTLLELVGIEGNASFRGESFAPVVLEGADILDPVRYAQAPTRLQAAKDPDGLGDFITARTKRYKWIGRLKSSDPVQIYDLENDPLEKRNLVADAELRARGREALQLYREKSRDAPVAAERPVDDETQRKLQALGYVD